ncbi:hypothetical protein [Leucobacter denitrificans]|uniref:Uncharacterized protein n=1 Tax=Leucobacter denitrificans TaxID=683042 RepID=A0A7G9S6V2_9MICO|nr:hypothetical protein [Leucobacter denitrificans]QNN63577.1 hypothetical protein H9L06_04500 [Leucobacter denitrificans]
MSRNPLDELFGPRDDEESGKESARTEAEAEAKPEPGKEDETADNSEAGAESLTGSDAVTGTEPEAAEDLRPVILPEPVPAPKAAPTLPMTTPMTPSEPDEIAELFAGLPELPEVPETEVMGSLAGAAPPVSAAPVAASSQFAAPMQQRTAADELPTSPVPARGKGSRRALPWIIVGIVAVLMLIGAFIFVNAITGSDSEPEQTADAPTTQETPSEEPSEVPSETPSETPSEEPPVDEAPAVDVGTTFPMEISYAGITVDVSHQFTNVEWFYQAGPPERVLIQSGLMNSFPDSCAAMRSPEGLSPWGLERAEDDTWTVVRPAGTCEAAPELYDQVWGLMQAMADSATPLS